jgi:hypothetical protein
VLLAATGISPKPLSAQKIRCEGARRPGWAGKVGSRLPTSGMMGRVQGAVAAGVKALRPLRGGPVGRP